MDFMKQQEESRTEEEEEEEEIPISNHSNHEIHPMLSTEKQGEDSQMEILHFAPVACEKSTEIDPIKQKNREDDGPEISDADEDGCQNFSDVISMETDEVRRKIRDNESPEISVVDGCQHLPDSISMEKDEIEQKQEQGPEMSADEEGSLPLSDVISNGTGSSQSTRVYQVWPGKNVFFFNGHLICGPNPRGFLLTTISILLSNWIFCIHIGDSLSKYSPVIIKFSMVLTIIVLVNLVILCTRDPGIIPRNDQMTATEDDQMIVLNGMEIKLKYCRICKLIRPPRSCHCAICDNCVEKFDHHCLWIGQCIGLLNYRFYLMLISSTLVLFIYIFTFSCWRIKQRMCDSGAGLFATFRNVTEAFVLTSFSFFAICFLGGLLTYNGYLILINQFKFDGFTFINLLLIPLMKFLFPYLLANETAYENFKQVSDSWVNPYHKGILRNIKEALFVKLPTSKVDFQAIVVPSQCNPNAMSRISSNKSKFMSNSEFNEFV